MDPLNNYYGLAVNGTKTPHKGHGAWFRMNRMRLAVVLAAFNAGIAPLHAAESGTSVVVIYNSKMAESKQVADH